MADADELIPPGAPGAPEEGVAVPDAARLELGESGDAADLLGEAGASGGWGESFEVLTAVDGTMVVRIMGDLDIAAVPALEAAVEPILAQGAGRLVVDVSALEFTDSSGIALWVRWAKRVPDLEVRDPSPRLRWRLVRMGLADRLRITS